ncbi:MAG: TIGR04282 family arsenosugar biosynthesis glycosyltransferase [Nitrospirae bacterium]|nr:TIGR04282 family arsenosugar biosynthesis glycosyltransferase [Nitrospirota bacterium]
MNRNVYGIMIKYPEPGRVKTRLARDVGHKKAAEIYRDITELVIINTLPVGQNYRRIILYDPPERLGDFEQWLPGNHFVLQQGNDIGERMDNAIRELLTHGAERAVLTGADIPGLNSDVIAGAFTALDHADLVIGPAKDGGYYLIGMKKPHPEIFLNITWSTAEVLEQTVGVIEELHLTVAYTPVLADTDRVEDLAHFPRP